MIIHSDLDREKSDSLNLPWSVLLHVNSALTHKKIWHSCACTHRHTHILHCAKNWNDVAGIYLLIPANLHLLNGGHNSQSGTDFFDFCGTSNVRSANAVSRCLACLICLRWQTHALWWNIEINQHNWFSCGLPWRNYSETLYEVNSMKQNKTIGGRKSRCFKITYMNWRKT